MKIFNSLKLKIDWKQAMLYEMALLSIGIVIGSTWPSLFTGMVKITLLVIFAMAGGYVLLLWVQQNKKIFGYPRRSKDADEDKEEK
ncbi:MAG: hypothetical protein ACLFNR_00390 [Candidatus Paceibacterota bacterium]